MPHVLQCSPRLPWVQAAPSCLWDLTSWRTLFAVVARCFAGCIAMSRPAECWNPGKGRGCFVQADVANGVCHGWKHSSSIGRHSRRCQ